MQGTQDEQARQAIATSTGYWFVFWEYRGGVVRGAGGGMGETESGFGSEGLSHERNKIRLECRGVPEVAQR